MTRPLNAGKAGESASKGHWTTGPSIMLSHPSRLEVLQPILKEIDGSVVTGF